MTQLLFGHDRTVADFVGRMLGKPFSPPYSAIGVLREDGALAGGAVFTTYCNGASIELNLAGRAAMSREVWRAIIAYVFGQLECSRLEMHTRRSNPFRKQMSRMGLVFEGTSRRLYGNEDGLCYSLTVDDLPAFCSRWRL